MVVVFYLVSLNVCATHYLGFYVYVERQYSQGPWERVNLFSNQENKFLEPHFHEDLLGSLNEDMVKTLLGHLKEHSPELYQWKYDLKINEDTVWINTLGRMDDFERVVNEITATLALNGFKTVCFSKMPLPNVFTIKNVSIPYFDLVRNNRLVEDAEIPEVKLSNVSEIKGVEDEKNKFSLGLIISVILNVAFFVVLVFRS